MPEPPDMKDEEYLEAMRGWVYIAVKAIAQEVAKIKLVLYRKKGNKIERIDDHELTDLINDVNPFSNRFEFLEGIQSYLELVGESFVYKSKANGHTKQLYLLRPDWVTILPPKDKNQFIGGYRYVVAGQTEGVDYAPEDVIQLKYFNPKNVYRGMGALQAAAYAYDVDLFATKWNRNFFYNNAMPDAILTTEQNVKPKIVERIRAEWNSKFRGVGNAHKLAILGGGLKLDTSLRQTIKEMDFLNLRRFSRDEIFTIFQVPKTIVAITEDVNRANAKEGKAAWIENTIKPKCDRLVAFLNENLVNEWGDEYYLGYEDPSPENVDMKLNLVEKGASILTINERRELIGYDPVDGGDEIYIPTPFSNQDNGGNQDENSNDNKEDDKKDSKDSEKLYSGVFKVLKVKRHEKGIDEGVVVIHKTTLVDRLKRKIKEELKDSGVTEQLRKMVYETMTATKSYKKTIKTIEKTSGVKKKDQDEEVVELTREKAEAFWQQMITRSEPQEVTLRKKLSKFLDAQQKRVIDNLTTNRKDFSKSLVTKDVDNYIFSVDEEMNVMIKLVEKLIQKIVAQAGQDALALLNLTENFEFTEAANQAIDNYNLLLARSVNTTTYEVLRGAIQAGITAGDSNEVISGRIGEIYENIKKTRLDNIVRTETIRANNLGNLMGYKQSGMVEFKEWLVALDERTCGFCLQMEKKYKTVALEANFLEKGSELSYKDEDGKEHTMKIGYDDLLAPPLHPQCRCTIIPVVKIA